MSSKREQIDKILRTVALLMAGLQCFVLYARDDVVADSVAAGSDNRLAVSLLTCYPGPDIYNLYGHSAIRIREQGNAPGELMDSVWNFGLFDFNDSDFAYRFVKGETDYLVGGERFDWFLLPYRMSGRTVVEQDLAMTQEESQRLLQSLQILSLPQNCTYRYNYVKNNCATRVAESIEGALTDSLHFKGAGKYASYRDEMRAYDGGYPWYCLGIDLLLGNGIDGAITPREEMFVPMEMMERFATASKGDGTPLVKETRTLYQGLPTAVMAPTPWHKGPLAWSIIALAAAIVVAVMEIRRGKGFRIVNAVWFTMLGLAGSLVAFMVTSSEHEATSPNALIWWMNPLALLVPLTIWWRRTRMCCAVVMALLALGSGALLAAWPWIEQTVTVPALLLMATSFVLSASYAIITIRNLLNNKRK